VPAQHTSRAESPLERDPGHSDTDCKAFFMRDRPPRGLQDGAVSVQEESRWAGAGPPAFSAADVEPGSEKALGLRSFCGARSGLTEENNESVAIVVFRGGRAARLDRRGTVRSTRARSDQLPHPAPALVSKRGAKKRDDQAGRSRHVDAVERRVAGAIFGKPLASKALSLGTGAAAGGLGRGRRGDVSRTRACAFPAGLTQVSLAGPVRDSGGGVCRATSTSE